MVPRRLWLALALLPILLISAMPNRFTHPRELARAADKVALSPHDGEGITLGLPQDWVRQPQSTGVTGKYTASFAAPVCTADTNTLCGTLDTAWPVVAISVERASSRATPPGDELAAQLNLQATHTESATVNGIPAMYYRESDESRWHSTVVITFQDVYYHLRFSRGLVADPQGEAVVAAILATVILKPDYAPVPFGVDALSHRLYLPWLEQSRSAAALPATGFANASLGLNNVSVTLNNSVIDRSAIAQYGLTFGPQRDNSDSCYFTSLFASDGSLQATGCDIYSTGVDGAHFMDCALAAGNVPGARCRVWDSYLRIDDLRTFVLNSGMGAILPAGVQPQPGDLLFLSHNGAFCWGGIAVEQTTANADGVLVATHSEEHARVDPTSLWCGSGNASTTLQQYIRLDTTPPSIAITAPTAGALHPARVEVQTIAGDDSALSELTYTFQVSYDGAAAITLANRVNTGNLAIDLATPCRQATVTVTAYDLVGNVSTPASVAVNVLLWGDVNRNGRIDNDDLRLIEAAWGTIGGDADYLPAYDINNDNRIDHTDSDWVRERLTNSCN